MITYSYQAPNRGMMVVYGLYSWPSFSNWMVPGTVNIEEDLDEGDTSSSPWGQF